MGRTGMGRLFPAARTLIGVVVVAVGAMTAAPAAATRVPGVATGDAERATIERALQDADSLLRRDWRAELRPVLDKLPEARETRTVAGPLSGQVMADTVHLPANVEVAGDLTIVARHITFAGTRVTIAGQGHDVTLLPLDSMRATPTAGGDVAALAVITLDQSGAEGPSGFPGSNGSDGFPGMEGRPGTDYGPGNDCVVDVAGDGGQGNHGGSGQQGTGGNDGGSGGSISVDIPAGSTDQYVLRAAGGKGGSGGPGGSGGSGGLGGRGGEGGDVYCPYGPGGRGGNGGNGGNGGQGGTGGSGRNGGNGGTITVRYPDGYDPGTINTDVSGGAAGDGGPAGAPGLPGPGGAGGGPGTNTGNGQIGESGYSGSGGSFGSPGSIGGGGGRGQNGTVTLVGTGLTTLSADKAVYEAGQSAVYTVSGKPNHPILWSSWKDGVSTGEVDANYGQVTDAAGNWTGTLGPWQPGDVSSNYEKQAKVDGKTARIRLEIVPIGSLTRWGGWNSLQGLTVNEQMGVAETEGLNWYVFARASDNSVRYNHHQCWGQGSCTFSGWQSLGGGLTSRPVAAVRGVGIGAHVDVFARGLDGSIFFRHRPPWQGSFEDWVSLGGYIVGAPAVVAVNNNRLMVFGRGGDNALYVNTYDGANWSGYAGLGGNLTSDPVAVVRGGVVDVFGRNVGGDIVSRRWNGSFWEDWYSLGGWLSEGNIDAVATKTDNIFVFARAGQTAWVNQLDGGWIGWQSLGEAVVGDPSAVVGAVLRPVRQGLGHLPGHERPVVRQGVEQHVAYVDRVVRQRWRLDHPTRAGLLPAPHGGLGQGHRHCLLANVPAAGRPHRAADATTIAGLRVHLARPHRVRPGRVLHRMQRPAPHATRRQPRHLQPVRHTTLGDGNRRTQLRASLLRGERRTGGPQRVRRAALGVRHVPDRRQRPAGVPERRQPRHLHGGGRPDLGERYLRRPAASAATSTAAAVPANHHL